jgi:hypothetical protein
LLGFVALVMTPVGLEEDGVDLGKIDGFGAVSDQPPFSPRSSGPRAASRPSRQKQIPSSHGWTRHQEDLIDTELALPLITGKISLSVTNVMKNFLKMFLLLIMVCMIGCKSDRLTVVSENATNAKALDLDGMEGVECRIFYYKASGKVYCSPIFVFRESQHRSFIGQVTYGRKFVKTKVGEFKLSENVTQVVLVSKRGSDGLQKLELTRRSGVKSSALVDAFDDKSEKLLKLGKGWDVVKVRLKEALMTKVPDN